MSVLVKNIIGNYAAALIIASGGVISIPFYIRYMGVEAYGLIGFFWASMLWFNLLDLGFSPLISRLSSTANFSKNAINNLQGLIAYLEKGFFLIGGVVGFAVFYFAPLFAEAWFSSNLISSHIISNALIWMYGVILFKLVSNLYRASYLGFESQLLLNMFNVFFMALRIMGSIFLAIQFNLLIDDFFAFQFLISLIELLILRHFLLKKISSACKSTVNLWQWARLKKSISLSVAAAYCAVVWTFMTQLDKLIMSKSLALADYGAYMVLVMISGGVLQLSAPIYQALQPRLTALIHRNEIQKGLLLYGAITKLLTILVIAIAFTVTYMPGEIIFIFTRDSSISLSVIYQKVLIYMCWGNAILAIGAMSYVLQLAHGNLKLHVIGVSVAGLVQIPIILFLAWYADVYWLGFSWLIFRVWSFCIWVPLVHKILHPGFYSIWLLKKIFPVLLMEYFVYLLFTYLDLKAHLNFDFLVLGIIFMMFCLAVGAIAMRGETGFRKIIGNYEE